MQDKNVKYYLIMHYHFVYDFKYTKYTYTYIKTNLNKLKQTYDKHKFTVTSSSNKNICETINFKWGKKEKASE